MALHKQTKGIKDSISRPPLDSVAHYPMEDNDVESLFLLGAKEQG